MPAIQLRFRVAGRAEFDAAEDWLKRNAGHWFSLSLSHLVHLTDPGGGRGTALAVVASFADAADRSRFLREFLRQPEQAEVYEPDPAPPPVAVPPRQPEPPPRPARVNLNLKV